MGSMAVDDSATKLVLFSAAPCEGIAVLVQSENMVAACSKNLDLLEFGNENWGSLDVFLLRVLQCYGVFLGEPYDSITSLMVESVGEPK